MVQFIMTELNIPFQRVILTSYQKQWEMFKSVRKTAKLLFHTLNNKNRTQEFILCPLIISDCYIKYQDSEGKIRHLVAEIQLSNKVFEGCVEKYKNFKNEILGNIKVLEYRLSELLDKTSLEIEVKFHPYETKFHEINDKGRSAPLACKPHRKRWRNRQERMIGDFGTDQR